MKTRLTIFDYGAGNLHSLIKALGANDVTVAVQRDPRRAIDTDCLVLPGVGAFQQGAEGLAPAREAMRQAILDGLPTLGICLGMQLLFETSEEGSGLGLGVIAGTVRRMHATHVPQIGWNEVRWTDAAPSAMMYFANGFVCDPSDTSVITAYTTHESDRFPSAVKIKNAVGVQFHPEKSSRAGLNFLRSTIHTFLHETIR